MSKLFFDHLASFDKLEKRINQIASTPEEKEEIWQLVDELLHHRVLGCILDKLPADAHHEFLEKFHKAPYDLGLIDYLKEKVGQNIEEVIKQETGNLAFEILAEFRARK